MKHDDFRLVFTTQADPRKVLDSIADVKNWWAVNFDGSARALGDTFSVRWGETHVNFRVAALEPGQRVVWEVTDCHLPWLKDTEEWTGTRVEWVIRKEGASTQVELTHVGLVPGIECYDNCAAGWTKYGGQSLPQMLAGGKGFPN